MNCRRFIIPCRSSRVRNTEGTVSLSLILVKEVAGSDGPVVPSVINPVDTGCHGPRESRPVDRDRIPVSTRLKQCPQPACWWTLPCPASARRPTAPAPSSTTAGRAMRPPAAPTPNAAGGTANGYSNAIKFRCTTRTRLMWNHPATVKVRMSIPA